MEKDYDKARYSQKDLWWAIARTATAVAISSLFYYEMKSDQKAQAEDDIKFLELREYIDSENEYTNSRMDKITGRNKESIEKLKLPNTDK